MLFSSLTFLFLFLPLFLILYYLTSERYRNLLLFIASLIFYAWGEIKYIWVLLLSTVADFNVGKGLKNTEDPTKRKLLLLTSLIVNFSLLIYFKYSTFFS